MQLKHLRPVLLFFGLIVLSIALIVMLNQTFKRQVPTTVTNPEPEAQAPFRLTSPAFAAGQTIPDKYTCKGDNVSPALSIDNPPANTAEFVLVARDSNGSDNDKVHWLAWKIPSGTKSIQEASLPAGAIQGKTDDDKNAYTGPCADSSNPLTHYTFELYSLNDKAVIDQSATYDTVVAAINGKVITRTILVGTTQATKQ